jgi:hypothetical protein
MNEIGYAEIKGFENYLINVEGSVIRKNGFNPRTRYTKDGYLRVHLYDTKTNKYVERLVHRLVIATFVGVCPDYKEVNHIDGNKDNNNLLNLEYVSHLENMQHAYSTGLVINRDISGENNLKAKLKKEDVTEIRRLYSIGNIRQVDLAKMFGVDQTQISCIVLNKFWKAL